MCVCVCVGVCEGGVWVHWHMWCSDPHARSLTVYGRLTLPPAPQEAEHFCVARKRAAPEACGGGGGGRGDAAMRIASICAPESWTAEVRRRRR